MSYCSQTEKLIPLFVEGDLDAGKAARVRAHLKSCRSCDATEAAYRESQLWLKTYSPPQYDADSFADARSELARRVFRTGNRGHWVFRILPGLARTPERIAEGWVAAALLASVMTAILFWLVLAPDLTKQQSDQSAAYKPSLPAEPGPPAVSPTEETIPRKASVHDKLLSKSGRRIVQTGAHKPTLTARNALLRNAEPRHVTTTQPSSVAHAASAWNGGSGDEMLRIEIQTSDPAVRIIWFTPKKVEVLRPVELPRTPHEGSVTDETETILSTVQE